MHQETMVITPPLLALLTFVLIFILYPAAGSAPSTGFRIAMNHVDSTGSFTTRERLHRAAERSRRRAEHLIKGRKMIGIAAPVHAGSIAYIIDLAIGTPPLPISAIADTGSDLTWTQCLPCDHCFLQPTPFYNRSSSSSFKPLPCADPLCPSPPNSACQTCHYYAAYGDNSSTSGDLGTEIFTFSYAGNTSTADLVFGCGISNDGNFANSTGIVGLGRGNLSLISQLRPGKFSYCLTSLNESLSSPLLLGSLADLTTGSAGVVQSTPIIPSPPTPPQSSYYYLSLRGISVGNALLPIPNNTFQLKPDGSGGFIIDSGSSLTSLERAGYEALKKAIISAVSLPVVTTNSTDLLCFSLPSGSAPPDMPDVTFHFDGADMSIPSDRYMISDPTDGLFCLTISEQSGGMSILGNFQQQNMHILFDVSSSMLSFVPAQCDQI